MESASNFLDGAWRAQRRCCSPPIGARKKSCNVSSSRWTAGTLLHSQNRLTISGLFTYGVKVIQRVRVAASDVGVQKPVIACPPGVKNSAKLGF